jgi:hypothetical protein
MEMLDQEIESAMAGTLEPLADSAPGTAVRRASNCS